MKKILSLFCFLVFQTQYIAAKKITRPLYEDEVIKFFYERIDRISIKEAQELISLTSLDYVNEEGDSLLHLAVFYNRYDIACALIEKAKEENSCKSFIARKNNGLLTALDYALIFYKEKEMIQLLLNNFI